MVVTTAPATESGGPVPCPSLEASQLDIPVGRRVMVVSDLLLTPTATATTTAVTAELARALDTWDGPGVLIVAGNLFDFTGEEEPGRRAADALAAHPHLAQALCRFLDQRSGACCARPAITRPGWQRRGPSPMDAGWPYPAWSPSGLSTSTCTPAPGPAWYGSSPAARPGRSPPSRSSGPHRATACRAIAARTMATAHRSTRR